MSESDDHYKTLALPSGSCLADVKSAYRELAKTWHPDKYPYDPDIRKACEEKMRGINEAYDFLRKFAPAKAAPRPKPKPPPEPPPPTWGYQTEDYQREPAGEEPQPEPEPSSEVGPWIKQPPKREWAPFRRHVPIDKADMAGVMQVGGAFAAAIFALVSIFFFDVSMSQTYYEALRVVVTLSCLYGAYFAIARNYWEICMALMLLSTVFNPILPVDMSDGDQRIFNFLCPFALLYFWFVLFGRESKKQ